jgi:hypothetical protein
MSTELYMYMVNMKHEYKSEAAQLALMEAYKIPT